MHAKVLAVVLPGVCNTRNVSCVYVKCQQHVSKVGCGVIQRPKVFEAVQRCSKQFKALRHCFMPS